MNIWLVVVDGRWLGVELLWLVVKWIVVFWLMLGDWFNVVDSRVFE